MNFINPLKAPFETRQELPAELYVEGIRPTVSVLVRNPSGHILLVCPRKAEKHSNAFMFPQGPIQRHETPLQATLRTLNQECSYVSSHLDWDQAKALGVSPVEGSKQTKVHHVVFVSLRKQINPILNYENRDYLFAAGPNFLWSKIEGGRVQKRKLIVSAVFTAVQAGLLRTDRWQLDRFKNLRGFVTAT